MSDISNQPSSLRHSRRFLSGIHLFLRPPSTCVMGHPSSSSSFSTFPIGHPTSPLYHSRRQSAGIQPYYRYLGQGIAAAEQMKRFHLLTTCRSANRADAPQKKGGPCLSPSIRLRTGPASWSASPLSASARLNVADLGGNGVGSFSRKKPVLSKAEGACPELGQRNLGCRGETRFHPLTKSSRHPTPTDTYS